MDHAGESNDIVPQCCAEGTRPGGGAFAGAVETAEVRVREMITLSAAQNECSLDVDAALHDMAARILRPQTVSGIDLDGPCHRQLQQSEAATARECHDLEEDLDGFWNRFTALELEYPCADINALPENTQRGDVAQVFAEHGSLRHCLHSTCMRLSMARHQKARAATALQQHSSLQNLVMWIAQSVSHWYWCQNDVDPNKEQMKALAVAYVGFAAFYHIDLRDDFDTILLRMRSSPSGIKRWQGFAMSQRGATQTVIRMLSDVEFRLQ